MISGLNEWLGNMNMFGNEGLDGEQGITQQYQKSQSSRFHFASRQNQDITLMTDDGDKISIHKSSESSLDYMSFDYTKGLKDKMITIGEEKGKVIQSGSFEISVIGDLNEEEMADIQQTLNGLDQIMKDLKNGDLESVMKNSITLLEDKETLSSLNAVLQFSQEVEIEERRMIRTQNMPPPAHLPMEVKPVNLLEFIEKITDQVKEYLKKTEESHFDIKDIIKNLFSELQPPQLQAD